MAPGIFRRTVARARSVRAFGRRFRAAQRGGVALLTALSLPPLVLVSLGAIQLQAVFTDRSKSQDIADAAAIWGAQQLTVTPVGVEDRTEAFAEAHLAAMQENATVTVVATKIGDTTMKVSVDTHRPSFFFNLMPAGGFHTHAEAVAEGLSQTPLCVVTFGTSSTDKMEVTNTSQLRAPKCLVHANRNIEVAGSALLQGYTIQTGASAIGPMSPSANTGAPIASDPFGSLNIPNGDVLGCTIFSVLPLSVPNSGNVTANPGCYGNITVNNGGTLNLNPGVYVIRGVFQMNTSSHLIGEDVVLVFEANGDPKWKDGASVVLSGRRTGALAGFVIATTRNRTSPLIIEADAIEELTGTIYVPTTTLEIDGNGQAVQASDWTVMAVQALKLNNTPQVQINAEYYGSDVPVPTGVGNKHRSDFTKLTQ